METKIVYKSDMTAGQVIDLVQSGRPVGCPKCDGFLVMLSRCEAGKRGVHEGVYCSENLEHVRLIVDVAPTASFWDQFKAESAGQEIRPKE